MKMRRSGRNPQYKENNSVMGMVVKDHAWPMGSTEYIQAFRNAKVSYRIPYSGPTEHLVGLFVTASDTDVQYLNEVIEKQGGVDVVAAIRLWVESQKLVDAVTRVDSPE